MDWIINLVCFVVGALGGMFILRNNPKLMPKLDDLAGRIEALGDRINDVRAVVGERAGPHRDVVAIQGMPSFGGGPIDPGKLIGGELKKSDWARMIRLAEFMIDYWEEDGRFPQAVAEQEAWLAYCESEYAGAPE